MLLSLNHAAGFVKVQRETGTEFVNLALVERCFADSGGVKIWFASGQETSFTIAEWETASKPDSDDGRLVGR